MQRGSIQENCWERQFVSLHACSLSTLHGCLRVALGLKHFLIEPYNTACTRHISLFENILTCWRTFFPVQGWACASLLGLRVCIMQIHTPKPLPPSHPPPTPSFLNFRLHGEGVSILCLQQRGACRPSLFVTMGRDLVGVGAKSRY